MTIGIDIRPLMTAPRTGVGEYTFELLDAIFKIDRANQYILFYNSWDDVSANIPKWNYANVRFISKHYPNKLYNGAMRIFGRPQLDQVCKCDIFFSPNLNFTALSPKTKFILTVHDLSYKFFPEFSTTKQYWWHRAVRPKKQCERADLILTPSENTKRDIVDYYNIAPEKIKVIYPGVNKTRVVPVILSETKNLYQTEKKDPSACGLRMTDDNDIRKKYDLPEKYILFLGTIEPRKNIIGLIEAFEKLSGGHDLVIAGAPGWKNSEVFAKAKASIKPNRIKFLGFVPPEDKPALYRSAELFVYPSFYEGFGFPVLEAMAEGTPVITSNRSSLPEITGPAAYLIDPTRPEQITLAMNELLTQPKLREWHIQKGLEQVKRYSWENAAREWLSCIENIKTHLPDRQAQDH
jgi:glycosyltransferase involved in cell wall biosynthesis